MTKVYQPSGVNFNTPLFRFKGDWHCGRVNADGYFYVRAQDQLFSYKENYHEMASQYNVPSGNIHLYSSQVPSGEVWVVTNIWAAGYGSGSWEIRPAMCADSTTYELLTCLNMSSGQACVWTGQIFLDSGDRVEAFFVGVPSGINIYARFVGFKMTRYQIE